MKYIHIAMLALLASLTFEISVFSQTRANQLAALPEGTASAFIAYQPRCELKIEKVQPLVSADGSRPFIRFVVRNTAPKAISYFTVTFFNRNRIKEWGRFGFSEVNSFGSAVDKTKPILAAGTVMENIRDSDLQIVELGADGLQLLGLEKMDQVPAIVYFGIVTKVVFVDGTTFDDKPDLGRFF